jgi:outer membrane protein OmpA-like peptidoglycan-associated protein/tetratricopeptide (TPR) repeat protein
MKKRPLTLIFFAFLFASQGFSQNSDGNKADAFYSKNDYQNALTYYFKALHDEPNNPTLLYKIGLTQLQTEDKALAVSFLEKAYSFDPAVDYEILYNLAFAYQCDMQYAKAKRTYEKYKKTVGKKKWPEIDQRIRQCQTSHALLHNPISILIENAGSNINSSFDDYAPVVSADGLTMIFTTNRVDTAKTKTKTGFEDIYISKRKDEDDDWGAPKKIGGNINKGFHDAACSLSPDGKTLFLYYDQNNGDIYSSTVDEKGEWAKPVPLNSNINTKLFSETSATLSADGTKLYFSSSRPGGKGNLDIYVSTKDATGQWGKAINLGSEINTYGDEDSPFIHADGVTLYFSSDGHPGMGSSDIFKSNFAEGKWKRPQNLGYPLNSIAFDGFFHISPDKRTAYYATKRKHGVGGYDILEAIYMNASPSALEPMVAFAPKVTKTETTTVTTKVNTPATDQKGKRGADGMYTVKGKVFDKNSAKPLSVKLSLVNVKTRSLVATGQSDAATGNYEMKVANGGKYSLTAESDGYLFNSLNIEVPQPIGTKDEYANFSMLKADVGSIMVLRNILFDQGKSDLKPSSILELEKVRELMVHNPKIRVQINGHTDNTGDAVANKILSLKRALAVVNHLVLNGIDFSRLSAKGYGPEKPVASNDDEIAGRELNRRTEIEVLDVLAEVND